MSIHINAKKGEIAKIVLMPGDPYRARKIALKYLEDPLLVTDVRGMLRIILGSKSYCNGFTEWEFQVWEFIHMNYIQNMMLI